MIRSRLVVGWGRMVRGGGRSMIRSWLRGMVGSRLWSVVRGRFVIIMITLLGGVVLADLTLVLDIGVVLFVLVHKVVYDLSAAIGKLNAVLAYIQLMVDTERLTNRK